MRIVGGEAEKELEEEEEETDDCIDTEESEDSAKEEKDEGREEELDDDACDNMTLDADDAGKADDVDDTDAPAPPNPGVPNNANGTTSNPMESDEALQLPTTLPGARRSMRSMLAFCVEVLVPAKGFPTPSSTSSRRIPAASYKRRSSFVLAKLMPVETAIGWIAMRDCVSG